VLIAGCARETAPDAYGNVEAQQVDVAAEVAGQLRSLHAVEGARLEAGAVAAVIETRQLDLERAQIETQQGAAAARVREAIEQVEVARARQSAQAAQRDVLLPQREIAERAYERTRRLHAQDAATAQQLDQAERDLRVLREQIEAAGSQVAVERRQVGAAEARVRSARSDEAAAAARLAQIAGRVADAEVKNPEAGTVLTTYVRAGEFVQAGQRLYTIANLDAIDVRVYVTQPQLASIRLGQAATVTIDAAEGRRSLPGTVAWIASEAEFTPTPIQTRDERADLVYAVKIRVANEGQILKVGMPVDVSFAAGGEAR
jgi:HlyD family secretion protein